MPYPLFVQSMGNSHTYKKSRAGYESRPIMRKGAGMMANTFTVGRETLRQQLVDLAANNTVINEVYIEPTQFPGEPDLMGVTIESVQGQYVTFSQAGASPIGPGGTNRFIVSLDRIIAIDTGAGM